MVPLLYSLVSLFVVYNLLRHLLPDSAHVFLMLRRIFWLL